MGSWLGEMDSGENDEGRLVVSREGLRESFSIAANALASLYKKSMRVEQESRGVGGRETLQTMFEWVGFSFFAFWWSRWMD